MKESHRNTFYEITILACLVILISLAKYADATFKPTLSHDGGISLLSASQNQGKYAAIEGDGMLNRWLSSDDFISLSSPPKMISFKSISSDLNNHDIHPPLYFWSLGAWMHFVDAEPIQNLFIVNILFACVTIVLFYGTLREIFSPFISTVATSTLALSPAILAPSMALRQYELLMLCTIAVLFIMTKITNRDQSDRPPEGYLFFFLCLSLLAGMMTQMQFIVIVFSLALSVILVRNSLRTVVLFGASVTVSLITFTLINRDFIFAFARHRDQLEDISMAEIIIRIRRVVFSVEDIFGLETLASFALLVLILCLSIFSIYKRKYSDVERLWIIFGITSLVMYLTLFVSLQVPRHAIGTRYYLPFLPGLFALVAVYLSRIKPTFFVALLPILLGATSLTILMRELPDRKRDQVYLAQALEKASAIYVNNPARGILSPLLPFIPEDKNMFVSDGISDFASFRDSVDYLRHGDIVIMRGGYRISREINSSQKEYLSMKFQLHPVGVAGVYSLLEKF